jgi:hypothetical protein
MSNYLNNSPSYKFPMSIPSDEFGSQPLYRAPDKHVDERLEKISHVLDRLFRIPGTDIRFGLDPIIGFLLPVAGDSVSTLISMYIVLRSIQYGLPKIVIGRMVFNIALDYVVGSVPFVGDFLDFVIKANEKNIDLLNRFAEGKDRSRWTDYLWLFMLLALLGGFILGWVVLIFWLIHSLSNFSII